MTLADIDGSRMSGISAEYRAILTSKAQQNAEMHRARVKHINDLIELTTVQNIKELVPSLYPHLQLLLKNSLIQLLCSDSALPVIHTAIQSEIPENRREPHVSTATEQNISSAILKVVEAALKAGERYYSDHLNLLSTNFSLWLDDPAAMLGVVAMCKVLIQNSNLEHAKQKHGDTVEIMKMELLRYGVFFTVVEQSNTSAKSSAVLARDRSMTFVSVIPMIGANH